jgi:Bardet-Biedl syndrome 2 protein
VDGEGIFMKSINSTNYYLVRGYLQASPEIKGNLMDKSVDEEVIQQLIQKKQELTQQLKNFKENIKQASSKDPETLAGPVNRATKVICKLEINSTTKELELVVQTTHASTIRSVVIFAGYKMVPSLY